MRHPIFHLILICFFISCSNDSPNSSTLQTDTKLIQNGDIIFQESQSSLSEMIQFATKSRYSHVGIIYEQNGKQLVYEAVQPVKITPLAQWINRGKDKHYIVKRLKNAADILTPTVLQKMKKIGEKHIGKDYDGFFEWSDKKMYCSELVWKIYQEGAGVAIGQPQPIRAFDLNHPTIKNLIQKRYKGVIPEEEKIISPAAMFDSPLLQNVPLN